MKKIISTALVALLIACTVFTFAAFAEDEGRVITVNLDGAPIAFDVPPQLIDGRTMVPLRAIFEALGATVEWDDATWTAKATKDDTTIEITIEEKILYKNGNPITLDVPAKLINERTLVPVRAISESLDVLVGWDDATSTVSLTTRKHAELAAEDFTAGNGYNIISKDNEVLSKNSPVTVEKTEEGIKVSHGGYYVDGKNWGGVALNEKHLLDGLSVTIKFDKVPEVTSADDCWISIDFLTKPQLFQVGDVEGNPGFMNLIRFGKPAWELYEGVSSWKGVDTTKENNDMFAVKTGDVVTVTAKLVDGKYQFTYTNGDKSMTWKYNANDDFAGVFEDGLAHVVVSASLKGSEEGAFEYTITDISYFE